MALQSVEKAKLDYTDKYVKIVDGPPALARFANVVGQVKTVNRNGHALVEFTNYHQNIGWYDIDLDFLRVVDKPVEETAPPKASSSKPVASKPVAKKKPTGLSPLEILKKQGAGKAPAKDQPAAALSPLEQLRQQGGSKSDAKRAIRAEPKKPKSKLSPLEQLRQQGGTKESAKPAEEASEAPTDSKAPKGKPTTADILAQLREKK